MLSSRKNDLEISKRDHRSRSPYSPSFKQRKHGSSSPPKHRHLGTRERDSVRNADRRYKNQGNHHVFRGKHPGEDEAARGSQKRSNSSLKHGQKKDYSRYASHDGDGTSHRGSPLPKRPRTLPPASSAANSGSKKKAACSNHHRSSKVSEGGKASLVKKEAKVKSPKSSEPLFSPVKSLKPFLEDIDSDEDIEPPVDVAAVSSPPPEESKGKMVDSAAKMKEEPRTGTSREGDARKLSKEELYLLMEQLDTDITVTEQRLGMAKDKQAAFEGSGYVYHLPTATAFMSLNDEKCRTVESAIKASSLHKGIYRENRLCVSQAQSTAPAEVKPLLTNPEPLYRQPCEAPGYSDVVEQHRRIRPLLLQHLVKRRKEQHKLEVELQERYDHLSEQWERKMEQSEQHPRKKVKDQKNRELFEKLFPELKRIKEPSEKINRTDARGINIVRSDAEFHELMDALNEQAETKDRHQRCHAAIPAMALHTEEQRMRFRSTNGLLASPLAEHQRETCLASWSEEEKLTFKRVYALLPKSFERIAKFLPKKTVQQCVQFYYLTKKREKYKVLVNAVREERKRRGLPRGAHDSPTTPVGPLLAADSKGARTQNVAVPGPTRRPTLLKPKPQGFGDWTDAEVQRLRDGMRTHGRMWSKVSRYVGTNKTAGHCKSFFQEHQSNQRLQLGQALEEHVRNKNLVRMKSKEEAKLQPPPPSKGSFRSQLGSVSSKQEEVSVDTEGEEGEVALQSESGSESGSSSTSTADSSEEETVSEEEEEMVVHKRNFNPRRTHFSTSDSVSHRYSEDSLDVLFSAAEIVEGAVSGDLALHDHTYALPHDILYHNMDMSATSGLSLIAAAAAVVSPTLSSSSGASPLFTPVKAPRGRPPNSSKRSSVNQRLQPTYLSPAGPGLQVPLTDQRVVGLRGRSRSTGTNVRPPIPQQLSPSSTPLSKMQPAKCVLTPTQPKPATPSSLPVIGRPSPGSVVSAPVTPSSPGSAFEALVNVAAAAPPAEMPSPGGGGGEGKSLRPAVPGLKPVMPTLQPHSAPGPPHLKPAVPVGTPSDGRSPSFNYGIFFPTGSYPPVSSSGSAQSWVPHPPQWGFPMFGNGVIYSPSSGSLMYPHQPAYPGPIPMVHTFHGGFPPRAPPPQAQFAGGGMMPSNSTAAAGSGFGHVPPVARPLGGGGGQQSDARLPSSGSGTPSTSTAANPHSVANLLGSPVASVGTDTSMPARQHPSRARDSSSASPVAASVPTSGEETHPTHPQPNARDCAAPSSAEHDSADNGLEAVNDSSQSPIDGDREAIQNPTPATTEEEGRSAPMVAETPDMSKRLHVDTSLLCTPSVLLAEDSNGSDDQLNDLGPMSTLDFLKHRSSVSDLDQDGPSVDDDLANSDSFEPMLPNVNLDPSTCTLPPTSLQFNPERFSPNMAAMSLFSSVTSGNSKDSCASPSPTPQTAGDTMSHDAAITDQGHNGPS